MFSRNSHSRRRMLIIVGVALLGLSVAAGAFVLTRMGNVSNPGVEFQAESLPAPSPPSDKKSEFLWPVYGYSNDRRRYLPARHELRPPFTHVWAARGSVLLEFTPVIAGNSLYQMRNDGVLRALDKSNGRIRWERKLGTLAASSPAYNNGRVYVTLLRGPQRKAGRVVALKARNGHILWARDLPARSESSPLVDNGRVYFGSENGTVYALDAKDGSNHWTFSSGGAVKGGLALQAGKLYFGDYSGHVYAVQALSGRQVWKTGTSGARFGFAAGSFYSTPAVAYGRVYIGNTDGNVYSFATTDGSLAWRVKTGNYVYSSPAVAQVPGYKPTVYVGSYDGQFYALDARSGSVRWKYSAHGKISGGVTVIGDIVYFSNLAARSTIGLGARTGHKVFEFGRGAFNPVVSDGDMIYLNGYSTLYALRPKSMVSATRSFGMSEQEKRAIINFRPHRLGDGSAKN